ncbi:hypothetical protein QBC34DRAFT_380829 [Podospora aff. communis PSN243]|uniref:Yeast cell wall synthesis Kre9/Knh1-like N-terminal domain-containing protein n=1 Tax=Podospora aff. communis PSN243 TaxID=3040156 RepID=A0AAV9GLS9_9PEZI|nr:hypothetical protein QBC34DRAFT_380829 [Podospora aff. communis PSN243]
MHASILTTFLLAASVRAIEITSPTKGSVVDLAAGVEVTWSTVDSDPKTAHLFLVNMAGGHEPFSKDLGEVDLSKGSMTVKETVGDDTTYQFNFQSKTQHNTGILAQSEQFQAKAGDKKETTTATGAVISKTAAATGTTTKGAGADATTFSSVVVSASGSAASAESAADKTAAAAAASKTSGGAGANASSTPESGAAGRKVGGVLALVAAGVVAVLA